MLGLGWQFMLFLACGGFAAFVNLTSRYLLTPMVGFGTSIVLAYLISMVVGFTLFRTFVFDASRAIKRQIYRFGVVNLAALMLVWVISMFLARYMFPMVGFNWYPDDIAHLIGTCAPAVTSFIGHLLYTFKDS
jgi:putative flippase GtrA